MIGIPHAPITVLPWTAGGMLGFCGFDKTVGNVTSGFDFLVVVPLTLPP